jgi:hypothetical protein
VAAFGLSLLANAAILAAVGLAALESVRFHHLAESPPAAPAPAVALIFPEMRAAQASPAMVPEVIASTGKRFVRTSADQSAPTPENPTWLGERNTRATSERTPDPGAPALPSQAGIAPKSPMEIETTQSDYRDGPLGSGPQSPAVPETSNPANANSVSPPPTPESLARAEADPATATVPPREKPFEGPQPEDLPVARKDPASKDATPPAPAKAKTSKPGALRDPAFSGLQRKTAVAGSITRTGRSALDVEDSPLGRYQATLSRAVEQEWQRNCVRHRDFITPGFLTVRFFVEPGGKVRSVQFVGDMETGEVQKGFTLNSIRDAAIPPMPAALQKQYDKEPLELIFRFYF